MGVLRATLYLPSVVRAFGTLNEFLRYENNRALHGAEIPPPGKSEAVVRERLVGFGHAVNFFTLLHRGAAPSEASSNSPARRWAIDFSPRLRAASRSQRMDSAMRRDGRTSTGTW